MKKNDFASRKWALEPQKKIMNEIDSYYKKITSEDNWKTYPRRMLQKRIIFHEIIQILKEYSQNRLPTFRSSEIMD